MDELRERLRAKIGEMLDMCDFEETPTICRMARTEDGRKKITDLVEKYVVEGGASIGDGIARIEQEYNINLTD